ncbi:MAG: methyltransferase domain-containing protein, partial [Magnetospirillum sp.]
MDANEAEFTQDRFLDGRLAIRQPAKGHRAGIDPVFLAAAVAAQPGERVLDLGSGTGIAGLCLLARLPEIEVTGLEIQPELARLARENAEANGMGGAYRVVEGSVLDPPLLIRGRGFD